jgi:hypothetical protein
LFERANVGGVWAVLRQLLSILVAISVQQAAIYNASHHNATYIHENALESIHNLFYLLLITFVENALLIKLLEAV